MRSKPSLMAFALAATVIVFQLACPIVIAGQGSHLATGHFAAESDAARYRTIVETPGTPYRDFQVEYPPVALGLFRVLGPSNFGGFRQRLLLLQVACQALIVFLLFKVWGRRAMWSYLVLSTPMLFVVYTGFDLVGVALAVSAAALVQRRRAVAGGLGFVVAAFTKLWPVALLPMLLVRKQARAFVTAVAAGVAGLLAWTVWGGTGAIGEVLTYRGARGWEWESLAGSILRIATGDRLRIESGAARVGDPPRVFGVLLTVVLVGLVAEIWWLAAQRPNLAAGVAETAVITSLLVIGTLLSLQFVIWPLPFVAIAAASGRAAISSAGPAPRHC